MEAQEVVITQHVAASPADVWAVLTELDNAATVLSGVESIERLSGEGYEVGTRWRETRKMMGRSASEEMEVTVVEREHRTVVEAENSGVHYRTEFVVSGGPSEALLTMAFTGSASRQGLWQRISWALFGKLGMRATRKAMAQDVHDIAKAAEQRRQGRVASPRRVAPSPEPESLNP